MSNPTAISWDPYNQDIWKDPYPTFGRMREESPLYYNSEHEFYALSRFEDVEPGLRAHDVFSSARGGILEIIKANAELPPAVFIFQDPPVHTNYRRLLQRMITPKRMATIEQQVRAFCARSLDPLVGTGHLDFIANLGAQMPMRVIGMLLGIPEEDQEWVRQRADNALRAEAGKPMAYSADNFSGEVFEEYIAWREKHPSDDFMTELLNAEFTDPKGEVRKLDREEVLSIVNMVAGAGNETTSRLIGWTGKVLAEHPDQRRALVQNPALIPQAIEELLRFEPPGHAAARYVTRDVEYYGQKVPAGSIMMLMMGAANRDERRFVNGDAFDIHRERRPHLTFGHGVHVCIGAPLARLEGRVALEEVLKRFPDWEVDYGNTRLSATTTVRGWDAMPVFTDSSRKLTASPANKPTGPAAPQPVTIEGTWNITLKGPTGAVQTVLMLERSGDTLSGTQSGQGTTTPVSDVKFDGNRISWINQVTKPMKLKVEFSGQLEGNTLSGKAKAGFMGSYPFTGVKA